MLARSIFEHSINYRSVVVLGTAARVTDRDEQLRALEAFSDQLLPGRWADVRPPTEQELRATAILWLLDEVSAKVRTGPPDDGDSPDAALDVWAGVVPLELRALEPVPDPRFARAFPCRLRWGIPAARDVDRA